MIALIAEEVYVLVAVVNFFLFFFALQLEEIVYCWKLL